MDNIYQNMPEQEQPEKEQPQRKELDRFEEKDVFDAIPFSVIKEISGEKRGTIGPDGIYSNFRSAEEVVRDAYSLIRDIKVSRMYSVKKRFLLFTDDRYKNDIKKLDKLIKELESKMKRNANTVDKTVDSIANVIDSIREKYDKVDKEYDQRKSENRMILLDEYIRDTMVCIRMTQEIKNSIAPRVYDDTMKILYEIRGYLNIAIFDGFSEEANKCYEDIANIITRARSLAIRGDKSALVTTTELRGALKIVKETWASRNKKFPKVTNRAKAPLEISMEDAISTVKEYDDVVLNAETLFENTQSLVKKYRKVSDGKKKELEKYKNQKDELYEKLDQIDELTLSGIMGIDEHFDKSYEIKDKIFDIQDRIWDLEEDIESDEIDAENMEELVRVFDDMKDCYEASKIKGLIPEIVTAFRSGDGMDYEIIYTYLEQWDTLTEEERIICEETIRELLETYESRSEALARNSESFRSIREDSRRRKQVRSKEHQEQKIARTKERTERKIKRESDRAEAMEERAKMQRELEEQRRKLYEQAQAGSNQPDRESEYLANLSREREARHAQRSGRDPFEEANDGFKRKQRYSDTGDVGEDN